MARRILKANWWIMTYQAIGEIGPMWPAWEMILGQTDDSIPKNKPKSMTRNKLINIYG
jgi:hypothetical protein